MKLDRTLYIWTKFALLVCAGLILLADVEARVNPNRISDEPRDLKSRFLNDDQNDLKLTWGTPLTRAQVAYFIVFRDDVRIGTSLKTSFIDPNLEPGNYRYRVVAQKSNGRLSSVSQIYSVRVKADYEF